MKATSIILLVVLTILFACSNKSEFQVTIESNETNYDSLVVREAITGRTMAKVPLNTGNEVYSFGIDQITVAVLLLPGVEHTYLTILRPGVHKKIVVDSAFLKTKQSVADSLVNYLWKSNNETISKHYQLIFDGEEPDKVKSVFDSLIRARDAQLQQFESELTADEMGILRYQNKARAYSFLMYYGRMFKPYPPQSDFFAFIDSIDNEDVYSKSLPDNLLYKYEIQMLREQDSIGSINTFLRFIETKTSGKDLQDFLKTIYLKRVIEAPSYWRRHVHLFTTNEIKVALQREAKNRYSSLIDGVSNSFYASQRGVKGYDFTAFKPDGSELKLSDFSGKVVVIDTWATWCAPCLEHRPGMLKLAKKYEDNQAVVFLMVSVDKSVDRWKKYVARTNEGQHGIEVIIPNGMDSMFGDKYLVKSIPKYMLIGKDGVIIDSNLPEPSIAMEQRIQSAAE